METIFALFFLGLSFCSLVVYIKSPEQFMLRAGKGTASFIFSLGAFGAYLSGDYTAALTIALVISFLTFRKWKKTKATPLSSTETKSTPIISPKKQVSKNQSSDWFRKISFGYTDSNDNSTSREVDVKEVDDQYLTGYCHTRRQLRTFRIDRIQNSEIVIRDTGELINVYDWIVRLYEE